MSREAVYILTSNITVLTGDGVVGVRAPLSLTNRAFRITEMPLCQIMPVQTLSAEIFSGLKSVDIGDTVKMGVFVVQECFVLSFEIPRVTDLIAQVS